MTSVSGIVLIHLRCMLWPYHLLCAGSHSQASFYFSNTHLLSIFCFHSYWLLNFHACLFVPRALSLTLQPVQFLHSPLVHLFSHSFFYSPASSVLPLSPGQFLVMLTHQNVELLHFMRAQNRKCCSSWSMPKCCCTRGMHSLSLFR